MTVLPPRPALDDPVTTLHHQITDALAELRGARAVYDHSPTVDNAEVVELCEWRLDRLLNQQERTVTA